MLRLTFPLKVMVFHQFYDQKDIYIYLSEAADLEKKRFCATHLCHTLHIIWIVYNTCRGNISV